MDGGTHQGHGTHESEFDLHDLGDREPDAVVVVFGKQVGEAKVPNVKLSNAAASDVVLMCVGLFFGHAADIVKTENGNGAYLFEIGGRKAVDAEHERRGSDNGRGDQENVIVDLGE